jgi:cell division protein FtsB
MKLKRKGIIRLSVIFLFALLVAWLIFGRRGLIHLYEMESQKQAYQDKIRKLEAENDELIEEIKRLRQDKEYIESVARKELNLVRDEELHFHFAGDHDDDKGNQVKTGAGGISSQTDNKKRESAFKGSKADNRKRGED